MSRPTVGFIGMGAMGRPMARRLLKAGYRATVWSRTPDRMRPVLEAGARAADSPADLALVSEIVLVCVTDGEAVEAVVFGPNGLAAGLSSPTAATELVVDHSSIHPHVCQDLARRFEAETGVRWVDAPVSGGVAGARKGTLVVMAGGEADDIERARPVMSAYAREITHMGPVGTGQATKAVNQAMIAAHVAVAAETLRFADSAGVDVSKIPDALAGGWADSAVLQNHTRRMIAADYGEGASAAIMMKDLDIIWDLAARSGIPMPVTALTTTLYRLLILWGFDFTGQIGLMRLYADGPLDQSDRGGGQ